MRITAAAVVVAALASPAATAAAPDEALTGIHRTEHFDVRFRPGSRAAASAERDGAMAERDYERITSTLKLRTRGRFVLRLYDDVPEMHRITGTTGHGGFSAGDTSHVAHGDDQTRAHELVHILALQIPRAGNEPRSLFFAEGLANAVLEYVHGVHVHAVAAHHRRRKELPPLADMTGAPDFYAWLRAHPGFNAYDVAASWIRFLLDEHGPENVKAYYGGATARKAFGAEEATLEKAWHAALDRYELRPEVETLLRQRAGEKVEFPAWEPPFAAVEGKPGEWKSLSAAPLRPDEAATWTREGPDVRGRGAGGDWRTCEFGDAALGDAAFRVTVDLTGGCGAVQVRFGAGCQGMLVGNGAFVWRDAGATATNAAVALAGRREVDLVLVRRAGRAELWVDGKQAVAGPCGTDAARPGVGFVNGTAVFRDARVRELR